MATSPKFEFSFEDLAPRVGDGCACDLVPGDSSTHVYNEEAFRYFLDIERKRSKLSNRPFLLLLVDLKKRAHAAGAEMDGGTAEKLFSALAVCLRETDFLGWYRANSVAGAVLTQHGDSVDADVLEAVQTRVVSMLTRRAAADIAARLQVRVYEVPPVGPGSVE